MDPQAELQDLQSIAERVLARFGFRAEPMEDENEAKRDLEKLARDGSWPLLLTPLDTSGEKPYEEFLGQGESASEIGMTALCAIHHQNSGLPAQGVFRDLERLINRADTPASKADIVDAIRSAVPNFNHMETGRNLDQRI
jgi:hypothetical protein